MRCGLRHGNINEIGGKGIRETSKIPSSTAAFNKNPSTFFCRLSKSRFLVNAFRKNRFIEVPLM